MDTRSGKIIVRARDEALRLGHDYIGTEHFVLAMLVDESGAGTRSFKFLGVGYDDFLRGVESVVGFGDGLAVSHPLTPPAQEVLRFAAAEAQEAGRDLAGPEHLLLGTIRFRRCTAVRVLSDLGVSLVGVRRELGRALRGGDGKGEA